MPDTRDFLTAPLAFAVYYVILPDEIAHTLNEHLSAFWTMGALTRITGDIANIYVVQAYIHGHLAR